MKEENDYRLNAEVRRINGIAARLNHVIAGGNLSELQDCLNKIKNAASDGYDRTEELIRGSS